jgi:hypothetical protein
MTRLVVILALLLTSTINVPAQTPTKYPVSGNLGGIAGSATVTQQAWQASRSHTAPCVEDWLYLDTVHGATDYGVAFTQANLAATLGQFNLLKICNSGSQGKMYTQAYLDHNMTVDGLGSTLAIQPSLGHPIQGGVTCTGTAGARTAPTYTMTCSGGGFGGWHVGDRVGDGDVWIPQGAYITAITSGVVTLALPLGHVVNGFSRPTSTTVTGLSSMKGLIAGDVQSVTCVNCQSGTTIHTISSSGSSQSLVLSMLPNVAQTTSGYTLTPDYLRGVSAANSLQVYGAFSTIASAVTLTPAFLFRYNSGGYQSDENQELGAGIKDITILDPEFRSTTGVACLQINGYDQFKEENFTCRNVNGAGVILGGMNQTSNSICGNGCSVRESKFDGIWIYNGGDPFTGQDSLEVMTAYAAGDGINTNDFLQLHVTYPYSEAVLIGSYSRRGLQTRAVSIVQGQIEGGSYAPGTDLDAPFDLIGIQNARDVRIADVLIHGAGYGRSLIRADNAYLVSLKNSASGAFGNDACFTATGSAGAATLTFRSNLQACHSDVVQAGVTSFPASYLVDGIGMTLTEPRGYACSRGCPVWALPSGSVGRGTTLKLTANPATSGGPYTLAFHTGGYYYTGTSPNSPQKLSADGSYGSIEPQTRITLGITSVGQTYMAGYLPQQSYCWDSPELGAGLTCGSANPYASGVDTLPATSITKPWLTNGETVLQSVQTDQPPFGGEGPQWLWGHDPSKGNASILGYLHVGTNNAGNNGWLGLTGHPHLLSWFASGRIATKHCVLDDGAGNFSCTGDAVVKGALTAASIATNQTAAASTTVSDHSIPIVVGGVTYYMRLSTTP